MVTITHDIIDNIYPPPIEQQNEVEIKRERERMKCEESSASLGS